MTRQNNVHAGQRVEQRIIKANSTLQTTGQHCCKYSHCVGGQNCSQMNNKRRHDPEETQEEHKAAAAPNMLSNGVWCAV